MTAAVGNGGSASVAPEQDSPASNAQQSVLPGLVVSGSSDRIWSNENPQRNLHFTGRIAELEALRTNLTRDDRAYPAAQVISGMGGVGKTEIATEYIHRAPGQIRNHLVDSRRASRSRQGRAGQTGPAAGIAAGGTGSGRDRAIAAVLEALASGSPAELAAGLRQCGPAAGICSGICPRARRAATSSSPRGCRTGPATSRRTASRSLPSLEEEAVSFLRRRVPALGANRSPARGGGRAAESRGRAPGRRRSVICPSPSSTPRPT